MKKFFLLLLLGIIFWLQSCGTTGSGLIYYEPSIKHNDIHIRRVAIVPNRLPLNLQDPEKWRKFNWEVLSKEFTKRGFEVVDYQTSVQVFQQSGLPVENTKTSRDKYAELANSLGVDAIVIPYYGTFAATKNFIFITNMQYIGVATFQIYLSSKNDFFSRIDVYGKNYFTTGVLPLTGLIVSIAGDASTGGIISLAGLLTDLYQILHPADSRWKAAFRKSIREGIKPFFTAFPSPR